MAWAGELKKEDSVMTSLGTFDYIIIGGGTAGCVLANRLSADPDIRVLLLEAGGKDNYIWVKIPVGYLYCMGNPRTDWGFSTEAERGLNGRSLNYPRGRILGGCSAINGMIYMRGQARDYDQWKQFGNTGWGWDDILPYFKKSEDYFSGADSMHGAGGEWRVEEQRLSWDVLEKFHAACMSAGIPATDDFNRGSNEGVGYFKVNQKKGWRWSAATGFLKPIKSRKNLTVMTGAHVHALTMDGKQVTGVTFDSGKTIMTAKVAHEVVLSAGAIGTPHILQLSGIGPGGLLSDNGVEVRHELAGVGGNLQDHLQIRTIFKTQGLTSLNSFANTLIGKAKIALEYALFRSGPMSMAPSQLGAFVKSDKAMETPDLQYHVQPLSLGKFGEPLHPFPAFTASVCNLRPESRGVVELSSPDPLAKPRIAPHYLSAERDKLVAADSIRLTRRIIEQEPIRSHIIEEFLPGAQYQSDDELAEQAGNISTTIFHPVGTAKMGHDPLAVVDSRLAVHGLTGLRIADASIMPTITSGNTNSPTVMIAEKAADFILEDRRLNA